MFLVISRYKQSTLYSVKLAISIKINSLSSETSSIATAISGSNSFSVFEALTFD